jgi:hypothetical protein
MNITEVNTLLYKDNTLPYRSRPQNGSRRDVEKNHLHTVRSNKVKPEQLILNKTYPTKVVINIRLLDMQCYKGFN